MLVQPVFSCDAPAGIRTQHAGAQAPHRDQRKGIVEGPVQRGFLRRRGRRRAPVLRGRGGKVGAQACGSEGQQVLGHGGASLAGRHGSLLMYIGLRR